MTTHAKLHPRGSRRIRTFQTATAALIALFAGFGAGGCATDSAVLGQANQFHGQLEPAVIEDRVLSDYLQAVGDRIVDAAAEYTRETGGPSGRKSGGGGDEAWMFKDVKFHFVNSKTLNAFTTGGEHMYLYNELFQSCDTEDELAAVMAHEYAHVYLRHVHKGMNRQMGLMAAAAGAGAVGYAAGGSESGETYGGLAAGATAAIGSFITKGFTREDENEADKLGFSFYVRAGYDPEKFDDFFQEMIDRGLDTTPEFASDHPTLANRVANTKVRSDRLPPDADRWRRRPVADGREFRELQARAKDLGERLPNDQSLAKAELMFNALPSCFAPKDQPTQVAARQRLLQAAQQLEQGKK